MTVLRTLTAFRTIAVFRTLFTSRTPTVFRTTSDKSSHCKAFHTLFRIRTLSIFRTMTVLRTQTVFRTLFAIRTLTAIRTACIDPTQDKITIQSASAGTYHIPSNPSNSTQLAERLTYARFSNTCTFNYLTQRRCCRALFGNRTKVKENNLFRDAYSFAEYSKWKINEFRFDKCVRRII